MVPSVFLISFERFLRLSRGSTPMSSMLAGTLSPIHDEKVANETHTELLYGELQGRPSNVLINVLIIKPQVRGCFCIYRY